MNQKPVWEDREIKFDIFNIVKTIRSGENILEILDSVEDTKGNLGDRGRLVVTNLRIIWYSVTSNRFSLSIGFTCVLTMNTKTVVSKVRGTTQALHILSAGSNSRFEFIFTNLTANNTKHFSSIFDIYRLYQASFLYRELKLRSAIVNGGQLNVLNQEQVFNTVNGVWNLSSDQGNLGLFIFTNVRLVWFAEMNNSFNISLPYMQIANIRVRESKYGPALVIQTLETAGSYVLGFRIDPPDRLSDVFKELLSLHSVYTETPVFGVFYEQKPDMERPVVESYDDLDELDQSAGSEINSKFTAYLAESDTGGKRRKPVYCKELGFAMEAIREGYTLKDLWEVIPSSSTSTGA
ncbi:Bardet-Biedl syndrome 5 protein homolog [Toxorhynchites rutilus septentrionalis]|uniref:Bardet-Biedl syndrome 5 protein homolog n=1 Tax=Toxorhynchites rutilus septentrionalis TaxID=329112 RepID=UPI00247AF7E5|nr:Bardet-Biedl syndrome 5 protein homolog [Toxorhynchites rutilus septentrionalis]XP_055643430.1 Bardet-Biedl syndrome 5 protein homolog [Toxorhynchites rutilus septentrionalis]